MNNYFATVRISSCVESDEGAGLLHDVGVETLGLEPSPMFVPHVLFNQVSPCQTLGVEPTLLQN